MINYTWQQANQLGFYFKTNGKRCIITKYKGNDKNIVIPDTIDSKPIRAIGKNAFKGTSIESVVIPESVFSIGDNAFQDCQNLIEVSHNKKDLSMVKFGKDIFLNTPYIKKDEFVILNNVLLRFNNINNITRVYIPFEVDVIVTHAFTWLGRITDIILPNKKIILRREIFKYGFSLSNVMFYEIKDNKKYLVNNPRNLFLYAEEKALLNTYFFQSTVLDCIKYHRLREIKFGYFKGFIIECDCCLGNNNYYYHSYHTKFKFYFDNGLNNYFNELFDIKYRHMSNTWDTVFNLQKYDDYFKNKPMYEKILYSYYRISLCNSTYEIKKSVSYITNPNRLKETINVFITLDITDFFETAIQKGWLNDKMLEYAISLAEKYGANDCYRYLKSKKEQP